MTDEVISEEIMENFSNVEPGDQMVIFPFCKALHVFSGHGITKNKNIDFSHKAFGFIFKERVNTVDLGFARLSIWRKLRLMTDVDIVQSDNNHFVLTVTGEEK